MDQPAQQDKLLQIAPDSTGASKGHKTLLVVLTAGIILVVNLMTVFDHQCSKLTIPLMTNAGAVETINDKAVSPLTQSPSHTSTSLHRPLDEKAKEALYQKGMYSLINRQFLEAINSFASLQDSNPEMLDKIDLPYAEALLGLADTLRKSNPQQAIVLFQKAIILDPRSVIAHFRLGMALTWQKRYSAAIESYQIAIELDPYFPDTFFNLGFLYAASKNYAAAADMYTRTIALQPNYLDEALFNLALAQGKLNEKEHSLANLKKALSVNPNNKAAQNYLKQLQGGSKE